MKSTASFARFCLFAAAASACAAAIALFAPEPEILELLPALGVTAYLDCAVVQRDRMADPDLVAPCTMLA